MKTRAITILCSLSLFFWAPLVQAVSVSPSVIEQSAVKGEAVEGLFTILNTGTTEQVYFLDTLSFVPSQEDGVPQFLPLNEKSDLALWISFPVPRVSVPASTKVEVPFSVNVPADVTSQGYYAAVTVSTTPSDVVASNGAIVEAKTAVLLLLTVEGETQEQLALLDFVLEQDQSSLPFGTAIYRIQNQGNVHTTPIGEVRVTGLFGQTILVTDANASKSRVLPGTTRTFQVDVGTEQMSWFETAGYQLQKLVIGPVDVTLTLTTTDSEVLQSQQTFWVVPWQLISVLAIPLFILGVWRVYSRKR